MKILWALFYLFFFIFVNGASADDDEDVDKLMRLPNEFLKKMDERDILIIYFGYDDLNKYLLSIERQPVFCQPQNFNPLDLISWVREDYINPKYYLGKEKIGVKHPVSAHISAIMIDKFPCKNSRRSTS